MSIIKSIKTKIKEHHEGHCCCGHGHGHDEAAETKPAPARITKDMIVKEVTARWPQTVNVFGAHKVDFCCGGAHSIEQTAQARGCQDIDSLITDLNKAIRA